MAVKDVAHAAHLVHHLVLIVVQILVIQLVHQDVAVIAAINVQEIVARLAAKAVNIIATRTAATLAQATPLAAHLAHRR